MSSSDKWENLQITRDEAKNLTEALKDREFRALLVDYVKETQSAEARERYQKEIVQLEKERGIDCAFVNPTPGFVLKTSQNGLKKAFINVCSNERIGRPTSRPSVNQGGRGLSWNIPYTLTPQRHDYDKNRNPCVVYDAVFHPDTMHLAMNSPQFNHMVIETAVTGIQDNFMVQLDQRNIKLPKLRYKGTPTPAVIRTRSKQKVELSAEEREFHERLQYPTPPPTEQPAKVKPEAAKEQDLGQYTTPHYDMKYRSNVDMENFANRRDARANAMIPRQLVVNINLPLLNSTKTVNLHVTERNLELVCDTPAKYKLSLRLPYPVSADGTAKFNIDKKVLEIILPVAKNFRDMLSSLADIVKEDSGVESDFGDHHPQEENEEVADEEEKAPKAEESQEPAEPFLENYLHYQVPFHQIRRSGPNQLAFTLWVKNADPQSVKLENTDKGFHIKFVSIGAGHFHFNYGFAAKFQAKMTEPAVPDPYENSIIVDVTLESVAEDGGFWTGLSEEELSFKRFADFPYTESFGNVAEVQDNEVFAGAEAHAQEEQSPSNEEEEEEEDNDDSKELPTSPQPKARTCSEGSGDESAPRRSILKNRMNRSLSESCADDLHSGAVLYTWSDSCISDRDEESREKKTVRFSQNIQSQTFRVNSSILGQRRKNQKRTRNKRKSLERRMSESENSEAEEREKWIKHRPKKSETGTVLKPVISKPTPDGKPRPKNTSLERESSNDTDGSYDEAPDENLDSKKNEETKKNAGKNVSSKKKAVLRENSKDEGASSVDKAPADGKGKAGKKKVFVRENSADTDASCDEEAKGGKAVSQKHKKTKKRNDFAFKTQFVNELD